MKYAPLVLKHLRKNWIRTLSTVLAMAVCIFLFCVLRTVIAAVDFGLHSGNTNRLVTRDAVSLANLLPLNYKQKIASIPGVKDTVIVVWFGGQYGDAKNFFTNFAVEPEAFLRIYPEIMLPPDEKEKWLGDVRGCIIGRKLAQRFNWKLGSTFQLESFIPYYRVGKPSLISWSTESTTPDEARYPATNLDTMYFNFKYPYEATGERIGIGTLTSLIADPRQSGAISKRIDSEFDNSDHPTKTETEQAFRAGFIALAGNLGAVAERDRPGCQAFTILLVTANTMSIVVHAMRRQEIAVLKTLGFSSGLVMTLIISEALLLGAAMGGLIGILLSRAMICGAGQCVPFIGDVLRGFPQTSGSRRRLHPSAWASLCFSAYSRDSSRHSWRIARASPKR